MLSKTPPESCSKTRHHVDLGEKSTDNIAPPSLQCKGDGMHANNEFGQDFVYSEEKFSLPTLESSLL